MKVHFVVHEAFESPGAYETWVSTRGHEASYSRVYMHEPLPESVDDIDVLVVMGGPQSPSTTLAECPHFDAAAEKELITKAVAAGKVVIGVCLGAQLIGEALGAPCEHSPETEIGQFPIHMTAYGMLNRNFAHFGEWAFVGHWHNDMPGLTKDAVVLATSEGCPRQIVEYSELVYGFQCHIEFTSEVVELMIAASEEELAAKSDRPFVQQPAALRANDYRGMNELLFGFLDRLASAYARQDVRLVR